MELEDERKELISLHQLQRDRALWIEGNDKREHHHSTIGFFHTIDDEQEFFAARTHSHVELWELSRTSGEAQGDGFT